MIFDIRYMILEILYLISDVWYHILDILYSICDTQYMIHQIWCLILYTWYLILDIAYLVFDTWFMKLMPSTWWYPFGAKWWEYKTPPLPLGWRLWQKPKLYSVFIKLFTESQNTNRATYFPSKFCFPQHSQSQLNEVYLEHWFTCTVFLCWRDFLRSVHK